MLLYLTLASSLQALFAAHDIELFAASNYDDASWSTAAAFLKQGINTAIQPCDNFFDFSCGKFDWKSKAGHEKYIDHRQQEIDTLAIQLIEKVSLNASAGGQSTEDARNLKEFFDECEKATKGDKDRKQMLAAVVARLAPADWPALLNSTGANASEAWRLTGTLARLSHAPILAEVVLVPGPELRVGPFPAAEGDICDLDSFVEQVESDLRLLYPSLAQKAVKNLLPKVKKLCRDLESLKRGDIGTDTKKPKYDQASLIEGLSLDPASTPIVKPASGLEDQDKIYWKHDISIIRLLALFLLYGLPTDSSPLALQPPQGRHCLELAKSNKALALARLFLKHFKQDSRKLEMSIRKFARNLFSAFRFLVTGVTWLNDQDRESIQRKVDSIRVDTGLPPWINDEQIVLNRSTSKSLNFYDQLLTDMGAQFDQRVRSAMKDKSEPPPPGPYPSLRVGASYREHPGLGAPSLHIHFGTTLPPLFDINYPYPVVYGALGMVVAHELMLAFSSRDGDMQDAHGGRLLGAMAAREYSEHLECVAEDYGHHCSPDNKLCLQGERSGHENMADIAGLKVAYLALKTIQEVRGVPPPIAGFNYSLEQLFFLANARFWCERGFTRAEFAAEVAPLRARVEMAYRYVYPFAKAFNCSVHSKYSTPQPVCDVWGDVPGADPHKHPGTK